MIEEEKKKELGLLCNTVGLVLGIMGGLRGAFLCN